MITLIGSLLGFVSTVWHVVNYFTNRANSPQAQANAAASQIQQLKDTSAKDVASQNIEQIRKDVSS